MSGAIRASAKRTTGKHRARLTSHPKPSVSSARESPMCQRLAPPAYRETGKAPHATRRVWGQGQAGFEGQCDAWRGGRSSREASRGPVARSDFIARHSPREGESRRDSVARSGSRIPVANEASLGISPWQGIGSKPAGTELQAEKTSHRPFATAPMRACETAQADPVRDTPPRATSRLDDQAGDPGQDKRQHPDLEPEACPGHDEAAPGRK